MTTEKAERCGMDHCPYPDCLVNGKCPSQMSLAASRIGATGYSADSDSTVVKLSDGETSLDGGKTWFTGPPTRKHVTDRQCSGKEIPCMPGRDGKCTQCCDDQ